jgi:nucleotide-binding universal stress UspA family protein
MPGVVVGVDRTHRSLCALRWAGAEAAARGLPLTLLHAWDQPLDVSVELPPGSLPELAATATSRAVQGAPASCLLAQEPDLLVLGGAASVPRISGVTRTCLRRASIPVVIVPETPRPITRRVVVGVNGSAASRTALVWAAREAKLRLADLVVINAWQMRPRTPGDVLHPHRAENAQGIEARQWLEGWVRRELGADEAEVISVRGAPLDRLLQQSRNADLLVLGHGAHGSIGRFLQGAVGDDLSALAPGPVAVVPELPSPKAALV